MLWPKKYTSLSATSFLTVLGPLNWVHQYSFRRGSLKAQVEYLSTASRHETTGSVSQRERLRPPRSATTLKTGSLAPRQEEDAHSAEEISRSGSQVITSCGGREEGNDGFISAITPGALQRFAALLH